MKHTRATALRCLTAVWLLGLFVSATAIAQRIDSLMTKTDVIVPNFSAPVVNGYVYYLADDGKTGYELWRTDGTASGTSLVKDIRPGKSSAFISDSSFYYFRDYSYSPYPLTTQKVKESLRAFRPYVLNNLLYFWADDGISGIELWRSDGTGAGTKLVVDLVPGPLSTGDQYDILTGTGAYLGGANGGYTGGSYWSARFQTKQNRLVFWSNNVSNIVWETDGTATGTREINAQTTKYRSVYPSPIILNGRLFVSNYLYDKGKNYYSLVQDNGTPTPTPIIVNEANAPSLLTSDTRGLLYAARQEDSKQITYSITRRDSVTAKTNVLKQIVFAKPTTGSRYQNIYSIGQSTGQAWFQANDQPSSPAIGKGSQEVWQVDLTTDSVRLVKRFDYTQLRSNGYTKGDEQFYSLLDTPTGKLVISRAADSTGGTFNRFSLRTIDSRTGTLQVIEDNLSQMNYSQPATGGKVMVVSRKNATDPFILWQTDGRTKQVIKTLGTYDYGPSFNTTDAGLVGVGYTSNYDKARKVVGYKVDVWKFDSTATGTTRIGQATNYPGGVGSIVARNGQFYGVADVVLKLSAAAPDSIRRIADIRNYYNDIAYTKVNNDYVSSLLGTINGRQIGKRYGGDNLLAIDPAATPRQCLIVSYPTVTSRDRLNNWNSRVLVLAPGKDSLMTLKRQQNAESYRGDITQIYYKSLQWFRDSTLLSGPTDSLKVKDLGIYKLTLRGIADGCVANSTFQVYNDLPKIQILRRGLPNSGGVAYLVASPTGGYPINATGTTPYYNSVWEYTAADGSVKSIPGGQVYAVGGKTELANVSINDKDLGTYTLKITDYATSTAVAKLTIDAATAGFNASADSPYNRKGVCAGSPVSFSTAITGGKAPYTVRWLTAGAPVSGMTGPNPAFTAATSQTAVTSPDYTYYTAEVTDADGRKVLSTDVLIPVFPVPVATLTASSSAITSGQAVTLTASSANYTYPTYTWSKDGVVVTGVAGKSLTATTAGLYSVTVGSGTAENCRTAISKTLSVSSGRVAAPAAPAPTAAAQPTVDVANAPVLPTAAIVYPAVGDKVEEGGLHLYPNPSDGPVHIKMPLPVPISVQGRVLGPQGNLIDQWHEPQARPAVDMHIDLTPQPAGVYIIQVETAGKIQSTKLIKK